MAILNNSNAISSGGYDINNSLRFRSSASAYLSRTFTTPTNNKIFTLSSWVKRGSLGASQFELFTAGTSGSNYLTFQFGADKLNFVSETPSLVMELRTTQVFRDPSAWYHIVLAVDTTQATSTNRVKIYVNGTQITSFSTATYPAQNLNLLMNSAVANYFGYNLSGGGYYDGYLTEAHFVDGQALTPSSFGETDTTTGSWIPKAYTSTYGTNGFYLKFSDIATTSGSNAGLGKDFSGNANYWTTNNISVTSGTTYDAMIDSPTNTSATVANYATWNPLQKYSGLSAPTNGNLTIAGNSANWRSILSTFAVSSGKWYCEIVMTSVSSDALTGIFNINSASDLYDLTTVDNRQLARYAGGYGYQNNGNKVNNNTATSYGSTYTTSDIVGIAFDLDNGKIWFSKNGTWQASGDPAAGTNAAYTGLSGLFAVGMSTANGTFDANFGQRPFSYTPPTGFVALNTYNLPTPTILQGNKYMDATLYTGTGASLSVTNAGAFKPDFVWVKGRSGATDHALYDSVRGTTKDLVSNSTAAETTQAQGLTAFGTSGFTVGTLAKMNTSAATYVGWQWQAGQGTTSSNTQGSITSTVSVNTTAGFSVVTWTGNGTVGATVGHGLGVAPAMIIVKDRSLARSWVCYHKSIGNTGGIDLNSTGAASTGFSQYWNNTSPTSSVFSVSTFTNENASNYVTYCWAEIAGFSKAFSYTGNGSADGPFVFCNFSPKFIIIKRTDSISNWAMFDTSRSTYNTQQADLYANLSDAEATSTIIPDILSNGFKVRTSNTTWNGNGGTWIGMAFASNPFKNSLAR